MEQKTDHVELNTDESRQAQRMPGMPLVLGLSTLAAGFLLGLVFAIFAV